MGIELPAVGPGVEDDDEEGEDLPPAELEYLSYQAVVEYGLDIDDEDLFDTAARLGLDERLYGRIEIDRDETILRSAEANDLKWGSQCRSGTCNVCTAIVKSGEIEMDMNLALSDEQIEDGVRLTCTGYPETDRLQVVFNTFPLTAEEDPGRGREPPSEE
ncbi:MAG: 2Fe-2S iron-sulfur cluster binding domain-containing protein [Natronomonas sp.]